EFEVLEAIPPQVTRIANGRTRYTFRYRVTAFRVGDLVFPPISVAYQSPAGVPGVAPTTEIPIVITSVIQPGEITDDIKPAKPQLRDRFRLSAGERPPREVPEDMLRAGNHPTQARTIYEILREGQRARFHRAVSYPARAQHAVRSALDAMRRAAVAEQYELMKGQ